MLSNKITTIVNPEFYFCNRKTNSTGSGKRCDRDDDHLTYLCQTTIGNYGDCVNVT